MAYRIKLKIPQPHAMIIPSRLGPDEGTEGGTQRVALKIYRRDVASDASLGLLHYLSVVPRTSLEKSSEELCYLSCVSYGTICTAYRQIRYCLYFIHIARYDLGIVCFILFLVGTMLSPGFRFLLRLVKHCLLYTSPSPRDKRQSRMPSSA